MTDSLNDAWDMAVDLHQAAREAPEAERAQLTELRDRFMKSTLARYYRVPRRNRKDSNHGTSSS